MQSTKEPHLLLVVIEEAFQVCVVYDKVLARWPPLRKGYSVPGSSSMRQQGRFFTRSGVLFSMSTPPTHWSWLCYPPLILPASLSGFFIFQVLSSLPQNTQDHDFSSSTLLQLATLVILVLYSLVSALSSSVSLLCSLCQFALLRSLSCSLFSAHEPINSSSFLSFCTSPTICDLHVAELSFS